MLTDAYVGGGGCFQHAYISIFKFIHQKLGENVMKLFFLHLAKQLIIDKQLAKMKSLNRKILLQVLKRSSKIQFQTQISNW